ncbi:MAG: twin-arginine translocase TatA/TatE family subunit [Terracidiphilus sp.]
MGFLTEPSHWIILLLLLIVFFGGKRLPELGKGLGEGLKGFKEGLKGINDSPAAAPTMQQTAAPAPPVVATPVAAAPVNSEMSYVTCSRCGNRFENPMGFKVADYVCRACQVRS